ncbi:fimbrial biogenesis chaperone [Magnetovibrio sp.]|uniref:fimbrial biogenesis chaperone n=1 Tax=Magnetovibrio sp. TaxID=2024836 RepID=UPI002F92E09C
MMKRVLLWLAFLSAGAAIAGPLSAQAQGGGDLVVSPTRVVFEDRTRSAKVTLANRGSATATFRISLIDMSMDDNGQMSQAVPGETPPSSIPSSAQDLIRYAPRQIDIAPGATQVVRLSLRKPANLADGEYRSHMFFRAVPPEDAGRSVTDDTPLEKGELRIQLVPIYGVTIPIIVRNGKLSTDAGMSNLVLSAATDTEPQKLEIELTRAGDRSAFGDLMAIYRPANGGEEIVVGRISRVAVYTPNTKRRVVMTLRVPDGVTLKPGGTLHVNYRETDEEGGKVLAESDLALN